MPKKGDNIYKRKDGRWEGRYIKDHTKSGRAVYGYVYAKSYREARVKLLSAVQAAVPSSGTEGAAVEKPEGKLLFHDAAVEWLESVRPRVKESTCVRYQNLVEAYIEPYFGKVPLCKLTNEAIENHCRNLLQSGGAKGEGLSPKTVSCVVSVIRTILQYALTEGCSVSCDAKSVHIRQNTNEMRVFSDNEQAKLCRYICAHPDPGNLGIFLCLFTGLRVGEVCALRWEDISLKERTVHVHNTMQRIQEAASAGPRTKVTITSPKSPCSVRKIPIPDDVIKEIASHGVFKTGYFLTNSDKDYLEPRSMQYRFKKVLTECGIEPANFHVLRHTFATRCVELGFDVKTLSEILGHSSVSITMNRYVHPSMNMKRASMKRLSIPIAVSD